MGPDLNAGPTPTTGGAEGTEPWRVLVVVPARNEEALLPRCLGSLRRAVTRLGAWSSCCRIVVVADRCTDATAERARAQLGTSGEVIEVDVGNVGRARARGVRHGLELMAPGAPGRLWLASTDADSAVPPDWLRRQLAWADRGVAGVAGVVRVDSFAEHPPGVAERFAHHYRLEGSTHPHVHGANLGVRLDAYLDVAGWSDAALAEDHALWNRLRAAGWPVVADRHLWVTTSGRRQGRAPGGFADTLVAHAVEVPPPGPMATVTTPAPTPVPSVDGVAMTVVAGVVAERRP